MNYHDGLMSRSDAEKLADYLGDLVDAGFNVFLNGKRIVNRFDEEQASRWENEGGAAR